MKHYFLALLFCECFQTFGQSANQFTNKDTLVTEVTAVDSTLETILLFSEEYAKIMATWSEEKIKRFNDTFMYTRGHITIPEEPIQWKNEDE